VIIAACVALCGLGCNEIPATTICGSQSMLQSSGLSLRAGFREGESWRQSWFLDNSMIDGVIEGASIDTGASTFSYDGELSASFFRSGLEFSFPFGVEGRREAGCSLGIVSGFALEFHYYDSGNPAWRQVTEWEPTLGLFSPGLFLRTKVNDHMRLKAEAHFTALLLAGSMSECSAGVEFRSGGIALTVGWRYADVFANVSTPTEKLKMDFVVSGPTVVIGYVW